jgi:hypothetical protein
MRLSLDESVSVTVIEMDRIHSILNRFEVWRRNLAINEGSSSNMDNTRDTTETLYMSDDITDDEIMAQSKENANRLNESAFRPVPLSI